MLISVLRKIILAICIAAVGAIGNAQVVPDALDAILDNNFKLQVKVSMDRSVYFPSEAAAVTVTVLNPTATALQVLTPFLARNGCFVILPVPVVPGSWDPVCNSQADFTSPTTIMAAGEQRQETIPVQGGAARRAGSWALYYDYIGANDVPFQVVSPHVDAATLVRVADTTDMYPDIATGDEVQSQEYRHVLALRWEGQTFICVTLPSPDSSPEKGDADGNLELAPEELTRIATSQNPVVSLSATADAAGNLTITWQDADGRQETIRHPGIPMPATTTVNLTTDPPGLSLSVDGVEYRTPRAFQWVPGTIHNIAAGAPQAGGGGLHYIWTKWSDELETSHDIYTPAAATTYKAYFDPAVALTKVVSPANSGTIRALAFSLDGSLALFPPGSEVDLKAYPTPGYSFSGWTGPVADPATAETSVMMNGPQTVTALFKAILPNVAEPVLKMTGIIPATIVITTATPGASVRYTVDGSTPTPASGTLYTGPVVVGETATVKAIAYASGMADSKIAALTIHLSGMPSFSPAAGSYPAAQSVTLSTSTTGPGVWIRYTTDGSMPTTNAGTVYTGPISVQRTTTIRAIAYSVSAGPSGVSSATYVIGDGTGRR